MPAVTATPTAVDWPKANIDAPDAHHQMALAHFDIATGQVTVHDMRGYKTATYTVTGHTLTGEILNATVTGIETPAAMTGNTGGLDGPIEIRPARGCSCTGYRRTPK